MPKYFITILVLTLLAIGFVTTLVLNTKITSNDIKLFNMQFEAFNKQKLSGADISSVINKAMDNNKKPDSFKIDINIRIFDYGEDMTINMEKISSLGIENFMMYYGDFEFRCTSIGYDKNTGRINELSFETT